MIIVPYQAKHMEDLALQPAQSRFLKHLTPEHAVALESGLAMTAMEDGRPLMCGGLAEMWSERALLWSFISSEAGRHFVAIHRATVRFLEVAPYRRIEAEADCDFPEAHRWLTMLGFVCEAPRMRAFRLDGGDSALYARVK